MNQCSHTKDSTSMCRQCRCIKTGCKQRRATCCIESKSCPFLQYCPFHTTVNHCEHHLKIRCQTDRCLQLQFHCQNCYKQTEHCEDHNSSAYCNKCALFKGLICANCHGSPVTMMCLALDCQTKGYCESCSKVYITPARKNRPICYTCLTLKRIPGQRRTRYRTNTTHHMRWKTYRLEIVRKMKKKVIKDSSLSPDVCGIIASYLVE